MMAHKPNTCFGKNNSLVLKWPKLIKSASHSLFRLHLPHCFPEQFLCLRQVKEKGFCTKNKQKISKITTLFLLTVEATYKRITFKTWHPHSQEHPLMARMNWRN